MRRTTRLIAREVIGPVPRDYEVVAPGRPKLIEQVVTEMRKEMGAAYRSHDARVLVPRGELDGTAVIVINFLSDERPTIEDAAALIGARG